MMCMSDRYSRNEFPIGSSRLLRHMTIILWTNEMKPKTMTPQIGV